MLFFYLLVSVLVKNRNVNLNFHSYSYSFIYSLYTVFDNQIRDDSSEKINAYCEGIQLFYLRLSKKIDCENLFSSYVLDQVLVCATIYRTV